ncbi:MAG TPA: nuclear transport factor 2 family protein [Telluria sp.]|jgi:hypothetical protein
MRFLLSFIVLACCLAGPAHATDQAAADVVAIQKVVDQFKAAIIAHDGKALGKLFLQDHNSWLSVADEAVWREMKAHNPQARKVVPSSWKAFAKYIQNQDKPVEERFYKVRIDTNGAVASVWFDFDFLVDGKVSNRGSESWQMVRAEDGWKISSMLFSMGD